MIPYYKTTSSKGLVNDTEIYHATPRKWSGTGLKTLFILMLKSAKIVKAAKALKAIKSVKALISVGTMFMSVVAYSFSLGLTFALGLVGMLFIHELGHVIACRRKGIPASAPIFIPFLGAAIFIPPISRREDEAYIGIGGPYLGSLAAIGCFFLFLFLPEPSPTLLVVSYLGVFLNLFNLIPIHPLDGGRITQVVGPWFKWVGVALLLLLTLSTKDPGLLLIWIIVLDDMERMNKKLKLYFAFLIAVLMVVSMVTLRIHPLVLSADIILASLILLTMYFNFMGKHRDTDPCETVEEKPLQYPPVAQRILWLCWYAVLSGTLFLLIHFQTVLLKGYVK